ncbi:hypothetical protein [Ideonella paludis]|uniref:DUF1834 family protein n=1 Tax=Ideonella paludis TaxID=1233411 RepID=A0ABS5DZX6_9BURK|nr:hypothetical protein [Ideonella paludis]MBQ0936706.1 hypothetical protein [Ideonella paludis]
MSVELLQATVEHLRAGFTPRQVAEVREYAGEFSAAEIERVGFNCPAVFVTCLGWRKAKEPQRLSGRRVRLVSMAAFVVTKNSKSREARMSECMALADQVGLLLEAWQPTDAPTMALAPLNDEADAENLYGPALDKHGLALWMLRWQQEAKPLVAPGALFDLRTVHITDLTRWQGTTPEAPVPPNPNPLQVQEDVQFPR